MWWAWRILVNLLSQYFCSSQTILSSSRRSHAHNKWRGNNLIKGDKQCYFVVSVYSNFFQVDRVVPKLIKLIPLCLKYPEKRHSWPLIMCLWGQPAKLGDWKCNEAWNLVFISTDILNFWFIFRFISLRRCKENLFALESFQITAKAALVVTLTNKFQYKEVLQEWQAFILIIGIPDVITFYLFALDN